MRSQELLAGRKQRPEKQGQMPKYFKDIKKLDLEKKEHQTKNRSLKNCSSSDLEKIKFLCVL